MQMLGHAIHDPLALEGGDLDGLGLLDVKTALAAEKAVALRQVRWLDGGEVRGYEIHHGRTTPGRLAQPLLADELGWRQENVWEPICTACSRTPPSGRTFSAASAGPESARIGQRPSMPSWSESRRPSRRQAGRR